MVAIRAFSFSFFPFFALFFVLFWWFLAWFSAYWTTVGNGLYYGYGC